jgi:hypothetical protein
VKARPYQKRRATASGLSGGAGRASRGRFVEHEEVGRERDLGAEAAEAARGRAGRAGVGHLALKAVLRRLAEGHADDELRRGGRTDEDVAGDGVVVGELLRLQWLVTWKVATIGRRTRRRSQ